MAVLSFISHLCYCWVVSLSLSSPHAEKITDLCIKPLPLDLSVQRLLCRRPLRCVIWRLASFITRSHLTRSPCFIHGHGQSFYKDSKKLKIQGNFTNMFNRHLEKVWRIWRPVLPWLNRNHDMQTKKLCMTLTRVKLFKVVQHEYGVNRCRLEPCSFSSCLTFRCRSSSGGDSWRIYRSRMTSFLGRRLRVWPSWSGRLLRVCLYGQKGGKI